MLGFIKGYDAYPIRVPLPEFHWRKFAEVLLAPAVVVVIDEPFNLSYNILPMDPLAIDRSLPELRIKASVLMMPFRDSIAALS